MGVSAGSSLQPRPGGEGGTLLQTPSSGWALWSLSRAQQAPAAGEPSVKMCHSRVKIMNREIQMIQASHGGDFSNREGNELVETSD